jgi:hypothetical protein
MVGVMVASPSVLGPPRKTRWVPSAVARTIGVVTASITVVALGSGCSESGDDRTTARVDRVTDNELCIVPEDKKQLELSGCFKASRGDTSKLQAGDCLDLVIPFPRDGTRDIYSIRKLDRSCKR